MSFESASDSCTGLYSGEGLMSVSPKCVLGKNPRLVVGREVAINRVLPKSL